jgi:hypothetical protein
MEKLKRRRDAARAYKELETKQRETETKFGEIKVENPSHDPEEFSGADAGPRARQRRLALEFKRINGGLKKNQTASPTAKSTLEDASSSDVRRLSSGSESTASVGYGERLESEEGSVLEDRRSDKSPRRVSLSSLQSEGYKSKQSMTETLPGASENSEIQSLLAQKTDMLEWDRQEREQEMDLMQAMMKYGHTVRDETKHVVRQAAKETAKNTAVNDTRDDLLHTIFKKEALKTEKSLIKEMNFMANWKVKMAERMVDTLCKVNNTLLISPLTLSSYHRSTARLSSLSSKQRKRNISVVFVCHCSWLEVFTCAIERNLPTGFGSVID